MDSHSFYRLNSPSFGLCLRAFSRRPNGELLWFFRWEKVERAKKAAATTTQALAIKFHPYAPLWPGILEFYFVSYLPKSIAIDARVLCIETEFAYHRIHKKKLVSLFNTHTHTEQYVCLCKNLAHTHITNQRIRSHSISSNSIVQPEKEISCSFNEFILTLVCCKQILICMDLQF